MNVDYLRNVTVKFLALSEHLSEEQVTLVPVLSTLLKFSANDKKAIDDAYNSNRFFLSTVKFQSKIKSFKHFAFFFLFFQTRLTKMCVFMFFFPFFGTCAKVTLQQKKTT